MRENYNSKLDELFERWIDASKKNNEAEYEGSIIFTKDGLMEKGGGYMHINVENEWKKAEKRIMFILKDQPSEYSNDARKWLCDEKNGEKNRRLKSRFIKNIANIFWGLYNADENNLCSHEDLRKAHGKNEVEECFNTIPFAFVESKKQGGKTSISNKVLQGYLNKYGHFLKEEIDILKPNMIVCTNQVIYSFVINEYFGGESNLLKIDGHNSIRIYVENNKVTLIFCSYHPSYWKLGERGVYEGVMDHYRAYLRKQ